VCEQLPNQPPAQPSRALSPGPLAGKPACSCPACRIAQASGARFCPECGAPLAGDVVAAGPAMPVSEANPSPDMAGSAKTGAESHVGAGSQLQTVAEDPPAAALSLPPCECGRSLPEDAAYCPACGKKVSRATLDGYSIHCQGPAGERTIPWAGGELTIGKAAECGLSVAGDEYLSRKHARLVVKNDQMFLEDLGSSNGTFLKIRRAVPVEAGDEILVGTCLLRLEKPCPQPTE
jgi:hypothetical protein